ncbi:MAG: ArsR/SmtB family transcription factor [Candidatus Hodarchaeales archaeon]|jgi:DNA-binding HxlR family transcriptional regulator
MERTDMAEVKTVSELIDGFDVSFEDILTIIKAISNNKRLTILITLLTGEKTFNDLKQETELKKTALSNHLSRLISIELIMKPDHNKYRLTSDGELFIRMLDMAYNKSNIKEKKHIEGLQKRQFSDTFVKFFFG